MSCHILLYSIVATKMINVGFIFMHSKFNHLGKAQKPYFDSNIMKNMSVRLKSEKNRLFQLKNLKPGREILKKFIDITFQIFFSPFV